MKLRQITEDEYEGLEDADEFDDGEDSEEIEYIGFYFNNSEIRVEEKDGVLNIVDDHGVLEGLPDGRRFVDDFPVDRIVTNTNPHMIHLPPGHSARTYPQEWFVIYINDSYALAWELGIDDEFQSWQTLTHEQVREMQEMQEGL